MNYLHYRVEAGPRDTIKVSILGAAHVRLLDQLNYFKYRAGKRYESFGGVSTIDTPVNMKPPYKGQWHVVIDLGGKAGDLKASVDVLSG